MTITVYSKPSCTQCMFTKNHLDRIGGEYTVVDITKDEEAVSYLIDKGFTSMPVVEASDGTMFSGFRMDKLNELVNG